MTSRVVVLGAGAGGLSAANRLAARAGGGPDLDIVLVDRSREHVFLPGYVPMMLDGAPAESFRRPLQDLLRPGVRQVNGEVTGLDPDASSVHGTFGTLEYDHLVVALGVDVGWPGDAGSAGELAPWTLDGALAGRKALHGLGEGDRVVVGPSGVSYRCPPAVFDLAVRIKAATRARVDIVHPWPRPLAPFGEGPAAAFAAMLDSAGVGFHGEFHLAQADGGTVRSADGRELPYDAAILVPPHRVPSVVARSPLTGENGWPEVTFPTFGHPRYPAVSVIGDLAAPALKVGMAGTLAAFQAAHVADRIAAELLAGDSGNPASPPPGEPVMSAICFVDPGDTGSFLHCDFTAPASGRGPADCTLMPWLPYFRHAKRLFAREWFESMVSGDVGGR
ncbi:sulfide:quinone oxidoreductase [Saccharomonospora amisosensis]|uniref:Sulfide:quinone oxidoreductase n=1 Tax=Saccharomonospora amisosensis TaxID=1128677 RepID=A0A7X5ZQP1_9PSEU|nr:FAD/NAD(P)-binding oxidoreductase [Saccharomonospora amisosensis]NIJ12053.1 sulfide:quinone oxidoreductase [Saccharomonospora amisosensis]